MRMRRKPNLISRIERCAHVHIQDPAAYRSIWKDVFNEYSALWLEIGCGKGRFSVETAAQNPECLFIAIKKVPEAIVNAMERAAQEDVKNIRFIHADAAALPVIFAEGELDRIFLNFCDPWPKRRYAKNRLTSPAFIAVYESILSPGGTIHFKTDNPAFFEYSIEQFSARVSSWHITDITFNLHESGSADIMTDYEERFHSQGIAINRLIAKVCRQ